MQKSAWTVELLHRVLSDARWIRAEIVRSIAEAECFSESLSWKLDRIIECEIEISYLERAIAHAAEVDVDEALRKAAAELVQSLLDNEPKLEMIEGTIEHLRRRGIRQVLRRYVTNTNSIEHTDVDADAEVLL